MKVAIYCRLSEEDKNKQSTLDDSGSIQNQKNMLIQYATSEGWEIFDIYSDDDYAGADRNRPGFKRLLEDAEKKRFQVIVCKTQSRFTRELELVEKYIHGLFPLWGIRFVSIVDNGDTDNKGNKKSRQINGLINEWYLEDMSDNIRSVLTSRRERGLHIGSFALYGYVKDENCKGHLLVDEDAARVVREVFTLFSQGMGKTAIARTLNDRGIPNPTEYKRLKGLRYQQPKGKYSTLWKYFAISSMLCNEIYCGHMVQGKYGSISYKTKENKPKPKSEWLRVEDTHEAIISKGLWDSVQRRILDKSKPFTTGEIGLFSRKVKCLYCGYAMRSSKSRGRYYLQCSNRHVAKDCCEGAFISVEKLEKIVHEEWKRLTEMYLDLEKLEKKVFIYNDIEEKKNYIEGQIKVNQKKIEESTACLLSVYRDKVKGVLSEEDYLLLSKQFHGEKERLECAQKKEKERLEKVSADLERDEEQKSVIEQYVKEEYLTREMVEVLIDSISVGRRIQGAEDVPVEIYWNF